MLIFSLPSLIGSVMGLPPFSIGTRRRGGSGLPAADGAGPDAADFFGKTGHDFGKPRRLGRGHPLDDEPLRIYPLGFEHHLGGFTSGEGFVITFQVMAFPEVSAHHDDPVRPALEGLEHEIGVHHARAHHAHGTHVRRILQPAHTRQVPAGVSAPVAEKPQNHRFKPFAHFSRLLLSKKIVSREVFSIFNYSRSIPQKMC
jgi:hypothetical protein